MKQLIIIPRFLNQLSAVLLCLVFVVAFSACQGANLSAASEPTVTPDPGTPTPPAEQARFYSMWAGSPHAHTYALEKGPNTYCARCHAPANWDYTAKIDPPPNCVSCKFPNEDKTRIAVSNPLVPESEWKDIGCEVCHSMQDGLASTEAYWLDNATGYYETLSQPGALCEKCHANTGRIQRGIELDGQTHPDYNCTTCHDPHTTIASCVNSGCHADVLAAQMLPSTQHTGLTATEQCEACHGDVLGKHSMETQRDWVDDCLNCHVDMKDVALENTSPPHHSKRHSKLECVACHDASGLQVGPNDGGTTWTTYRVTKSPAGESTAAFTSHILQTSVDCQRCHFPENPWDLPEPITP